MSEIFIAASEGAFNVTPPRETKSCSSAAVGAEEGSLEDEGSEHPTATKEVTARRERRAVRMGKGVAPLS